MASGPEMISLAGGMPNGAMFPIRNVFQNSNNLSIAYFYIYLRLIRIICFECKQSGLSMKVDGHEIQLSQAQLATALQYSRVDGTQ